MCLIGAVWLSSVKNLMLTSQSEEPWKLTWIQYFWRWSPPAVRRRGFHLCLSAGPAAERSGPAAASSEAWCCSACLQTHRGVSRSQGQSDLQAARRESGLHGIRRQCCSADSRWGYASVCITFFLIRSNIWPALFVSMWTWGEVAFRLRLKRTMRSTRVFYVTYNIKAFGHQKLIFIPQHLKEVQMSGNNNTRKTI